MRGISCLVLSAYWVLTVILTLFTDDGTSNRFLQWFMGVDEHGRDMNRSIISPVDVGFVVLFFIVWLIDHTVK